MISTLELKQFRGLEHVKFENLGRANLIIGGNNTGKTSILEALVLLYGSEEQAGCLPTMFRMLPKGDGVATDWKYLGRNGEPSQMELIADNDTIKGDIRTVWRNDATFERSYDLPVISVLATIPEDPAFVSELFAQIAPLNPENEKKLEELLRFSIEPRLRRLRYAKLQGSPHNLVFVDLGEGPMLPFTQLGQAFARTLEIYCEIFANGPKILLIDEIENGLYYEGMEDFWKGLMAVLEDQDVQLFATTHSRECMEAAHKAAASMDGDPLRFLRLDRRVDDPGKIVATTFGKEEMQTAIEFNRDMR
jgi:ABC-type branched-subunit amino acid transport system ATPase component